MAFDGTIQDITINMHGGLLTHPIIEVQQDDTASRKVRVRLKSFNGEDYIIPYDATAVLCIKKTDNTVVYDDCEIIDGSTVVITLSSQSTASCGQNKAQIYLCTDEGDIKSQTFIINVPRAVYRDDAIKSSNEFGVLTNLIKDVSDVNETASKALEDAKDAQTTAAKAASDAKTASEYVTEIMNTVDVDVAAIKKEIADTGVDAVKDVETAGDTQIQRVADAVKDVETAGDTQIQRMADAVKEVEDDRDQITANAKNLRTKSDAIVQTASGEDIVLNDSSDDPLRGLRLFGRSTQVTTTGAQLYDVSTVVQTDNVTADEDGWITVTYDNTGKDTIAYIVLNEPTSDLLKPDTDYCVVCEMRDITSGITVGVTNDNEYSYKGQFEQTRDISATGIHAYTLKTRPDFTDCTTMLCTVVGVNAGISGSATFRLSVLADTTVTADTFVYEPFTGGEASPSPAYPQEIKSVGDDGSVGGKVYGKNLLDASAFTNVSCTTMDISDDGYEITATGKRRFAHMVCDIGHCIGMDITIQYNYIEKSGGQIAIIVVTKKPYESIKYSSVTSKKHKITIPNDLEYAKLQILPNNTTNELESDNTITIKGLRITLNEDAPWEPYKDAQIITASTPNGLPGIPVTNASIANYTDDSGQMWCCDEVDFERGVYVQRIGAETFSGEFYTNYNGTYMHVFKKKGLQINPETQKVMAGALCAYFEAKPWTKLNTDKQNGCCVAYGGIEVGIRHAKFLNVNELNAWLAENPITVYYILADPVKTPLTSEELSAYQSLHTNYPTTTLISNVHAEVQYNADPKNYIAAEHAKMEAAFDAKLADIIALLPESTQATMVESETAKLLSESEV